MQRETKFRARRKLTGQWVYGSYVFGGNDWCHIIPHGTELEDWELERFRVITETVGEFTGLPDKNGKEIYEGDILMDQYQDKEYDSDTNEWKAVTVKIYYPVVFKNGCFGWIGEITGEFYNFYDHPISEAEIAGNVYDNLDLLGKQ